MATPLVLIPGLLCDRRLFEAQIEALQAEREIVVAEPWEHRDLGSLADAILQRVSGRFALAGLSMGGYAAFALLRRAADRVERVAFLCTRAEPEPPEGPANRQAVVEEAHERGLAMVAARLGTGWLSPVHRERPDLRATLASMAEAVGLQGFANEQGAIAGRSGSLDLLRRITVPTLVVAGRDDTLTTPAALQVIAEGVPGADLAVLGGCGHLAPLERPDAVTSLMRAWLAR